MKKLIELRTSLCLIAVIGAVALLANLTSALAEEHHSKRGSTGPTNPGTPTPTPVAAKRGSTGPTKPTPPPHQGQNLRLVMEHMKLKEGSNVIHTEGDVKIMAEVKGGKVIGYNATDMNGKALTGQITPDKTKGGGTGGGKGGGTTYCSFCILNKAGILKCYPITCPKHPPF